MTEPWLGHWDGCSIQHSAFCDCGPEPVDLSGPHCSAPFRFDRDQPGCQDDACPKHGGREDGPACGICGLSGGDHQGSCPETGEAPQPGAPG